MGRYFFMQKKQQGAALIFALIMLLLMSLLGVNAMQQNRLQFLMSANSQMQTDALANAENLLVMAESFVRSQRDTDGDAGGTCAKDVDGKFTPLATPTDITASLTLSQTTEDASVISLTGCTCLATFAECKTAFTACLSEIYSLQVRFSGADGTQRTVESRYAVKCTE